MKKTLKTKTAKHHMWDKLKADNKPKITWIDWGDLDINVLKTAVIPTVHEFKEQYLQKIHDMMAVPKDKLK